MNEQWLFNSFETRLYFYLLNIANRLYWEQEWIEQGNKRVAINNSFSIEVLRTSRERLKSAFLIDFISGGKGFGVKTRYKILVPKSTPNDHPIYNKIKNKTKINFNNDEKYSKRQSIISGSSFDE